MAPLTRTEIERFQKEVLKLTNRQRTSRHLRSLRLSQTLSRCAAYHTRDQIENTGEITHTGSNGSDLTDRLRICGYNYHRASENVASGQRDAADVIRSLMNSPGHRENILEPNVVEMGLWVEHDRQGTKYWTQLFGKRQAARRKIRGRLRRQNETCLLVLTGSTLIF